MSIEDVAPECALLPSGRIDDCFAVLDAVGTPTYAYFQSEIRSQVRLYASAMARAKAVSVHCHYALLANDNPHLVAEVLRAFADFEATPGVMCASLGHAQLISILPGLPTGCSVVFSDAALTAGTLETALTSLRSRTQIECVYLILNTEGQVSTFLDALKQNPVRELISGFGPALHIGVRLKLAFGSERAAVDAGFPSDLYNLYHGPASRFGTPVGMRLRSVLRTLHSQGLRKIGFHMYPGTNLSSISILSGFYQQFADAVSYALRAGLGLDFLDVGGGFGINYANGAVNDPNEVLDRIQEIFEPLTPNRETVLIEPGRTVTGSAGVLLARVVDQRKEEGKQHVIVDVGLSHFPRPYIYHQPAPDRSAQVCWFREL